MRKSVRYTTALVATFAALLTACSGSSTDATISDPPPQVTTVPTTSSTTSTTTSTTTTPDQQLTPMGNPMPSEIDEATIDAIIAQIASAPEGSRVRALSGNWNQALGYYPTEEEVSWMKDVAGYLDSQVASGAHCYQVDTVVADIASILKTDTGRAEYIVSGAMLAWSDPETIRFILLNCA